MQFVHWNFCVELWFAFRLRLCRGPFAFHNPHSAFRIFCCFDFLPSRRCHDESIHLFFIPPQRSFSNISLAVSPFCFLASGTASSGKEPVWGVHRRCLDWHLARVLLHLLDARVHAAQAGAELPGHGGGILCQGRPISQPVNCSNCVHTCNARAKKHKKAKQHKIAKKKKKNVMVNVQKFCHCHCHCQCEC